MLCSCGRTVCCACAWSATRPPAAGSRSFLACALPGCVPLGGVCCPVISVQPSKQQQAFQQDPRSAALPAALVEAEDMQLRSAAGTVIDAEGWLVRLLATGCRGCAHSWCSRLPPMGGHYHAVLCAWLESALLLLDVDPMGRCSHTCLLLSRHTQLPWDVCVCFSVHSVHVCMAAGRSSRVGAPCALDALHGRSAGLHSSSRHHAAGTPWLQRAAC